MIIATPHVTSDEFEEQKVTVGKTSRIQDGFLIHLTTKTNSKHEGVYIVLECNIKQRPDSSFELFGSKVDTFLRNWTQVLDKIFTSHQITHQCTNTCVPRTENTKWYKFANGKYSRHTEFDVDTEGVPGLAVIMTRGPWYHVSKKFTSCRWHLVEFCFLN